MELELDEKEAAVIIEALECLIAHPTTTACKAEQAIDLSHFLLALSCGHFDDWDSDLTEAEEDFIQQGIEAREQVKATSRAATRREQRLAFGEFEVVEEPLSNDPINW
tara:strand:+ start:2249 stop:2572 length:324 start_codon:yes stop_codon:yes gene_type:complete